jgi:hypothetical protein
VSHRHKTNVTTVATACKLQAVGLPLSSAEPYEFLVKLRNITWETNYVIVSQNALGMMGRRKLRFVNHRSHPPSRTTKCPLLSLQ